MPILVADKVAGLTIVYAVLAALFHRERGGEGQHIEVPMTQAMTAFMLVEHGAGGVSQPPAGPAGYQRILTPERRPQRTADGWINVLPYSRQQYDTLFAAGGREDLLGDARYADGRARIANSDFLYQQVRTILVQRTTDEWLAFLPRQRDPRCPRRHPRRAPRRAAGHDAPTRRGLSARPARAPGSPPRRCGRAARRRSPANTTTRSSEKSATPTTTSTTSSPRRAPQPRLTCAQPPAG